MCFRVHQKICMSVYTCPACTLCVHVHDNDIYQHWWHVYIYVCMCIFLYINICVPSCVCVCVCIHVNTHTHMHKYTHTCMRTHMSITCACCAQNHVSSQEYTYKENMFSKWFHSQHEVFSKTKKKSTLRLWVEPLHISLESVWYVTVKVFDAPTHAPNWPIFCPLISYPDLCCAMHVYYMRCVGWHM